MEGDRKRPPPSNTYLDGKRKQLERDHIHATLPLANEGDSLTLTTNPYINDGRRKRERERDLPPTILALKRKAKRDHTQPHFYLNGRRWWRGTTTQPTLP